LALRHKPCHGLESRWLQVVDETTGHRGARKRRVARECFERAPDATQQIACSAVAFLAQYFLGHAQELRDRLSSRVDGIMRGSAGPLFCVDSAQPFPGFDQPVE